MTNKTRKIKKWLDQLDYEIDNSKSLSKEDKAIFKDINEELSKEITEFTDSIDNFVSDLS